MNYIEEKNKLGLQMKAMLDLAKNEKRTLTSEENNKFDSIAVDFDKYQKMVEAEARMASIPMEKTESKIITSNDAFRNYLFSGEKRDLAVGSGGVYAPQTFVAKVVDSINKRVALRGLGTVFTIKNSDSLGIPYVSVDASDADWTAEVPTITADSTLAILKRELKPQSLVKLIKVSKKLIKTSAIDIETFIADKLAEKVAAAMENAYMTGDGSNKPVGLFNTSIITTARDVATTSATAIDADAIIDAKYKVSLPTNQCSWIMNSDVVKAIRKLKNAVSGDYLWTPGFGDEPEKILGAKVYVSDYAPNVFTASKYLAVYGDMKQYYMADVDQIDITTLNEVYSASNQIGYQANIFSDGMPIRPEAFSRIITHV